MTSAYDLMRQRCGLSQQEAADFHDTRLDTVKSWCSGRRQAPEGVITELQDLYARIRQMGDALAKAVKQQKAPPGEELIVAVTTPKTEQEARALGWPTQSACLAAAGLAIAQLPRGTPVELVEGTEIDLTWTRFKHGHV